MQRLRIGLVGTGPWARTVHGPGLLAADAVELAGVWGRSADKASALADELGVTAYADFAALVADVDAVAFAVPPDVQAGLALEAARAGRHLLLDKPVTLQPAAARELADEVARRGVASVVFFTDRFSDVAEWIAEAGRTGGWWGGSLRWLAALDTPGNPFADSAWRREHGALWDIGPHALSTLTAVLGPVVEVRATAGARDLVHLVLTHESGTTSTASLSLQAPARAVDHELVLWGEHGTRRLSGRSDAVARDALVRAAARLRAAARTGAENPVDVRLGARVVELLDEAERQLRVSPARCSSSPSARPSR